MLTGEVIDGLLAESAREHRFQLRMRWRGDLGLGAHGDGEWRLRGDLEG